MSTPGWSWKFCISLTVFFDVDLSIDSMRIITEKYHWGWFWLFRHTFINTSRRLLTFDFYHQTERNYFWITVSLWDLAPWYPTVYFFSKFWKNYKFLFQQTQELSRLALINNTPAESRARAIGLFNSIGSAGFIVGPSIGGNIREYFGEKGFYHCSQVTSALFAVNILLVAIFMEEVTLFCPRY